ncbi:hypothetical protein [Massilia sp. BKSP1R2A-1]|uniref:hypothetical protein n=1 Tax=Massilia sp. BKSP1R2A-1 TaxID=3422595 RepID=UPI003D33AC68
MTDLALIYRDQMVRAVLGSRPAILAKEADTTALERMATRLAEDEQALEHLRALGYGQRGMTLVEIVKTIPPAPERAAQLHDIWVPQ